MTGDYWENTTSSNSTPSNDLINPDPGNNATFFDGGYTIGSPYWRTEVGAHENSDSPYGTFDQGGNMTEWNENVGGGNNLNRGVRGGSYESYFVSHWHAGFRPPTSEVATNGFRVAEVP